MLQFWQAFIHESRYGNGPLGRSSLLTFALTAGIASFLVVFLLMLVLISSMGNPEVQLLAQASDAVAMRAQTLYQQQRSHAQRLAFSGIADAMISLDSARLAQRLSEAHSAGDWDYLAILDSAGQELAGLAREAAGAAFVPADPEEFQAFLREVLDGGRIGAASWLRASDGTYWMIVASPVRSAGRIVGAVMIAQRAESLAAALRASTVAHVTLYGFDGAILATTLRLVPEQRAQLMLDEDALQQVVAAAGQPIPRTLTFAASQYRADYRSLVYGDAHLGLVSTIVPQTIPAASGSGLQLVALLIGVLAGIAGAGGVLVLASVFRAARPPAFELEFGTLESALSQDFARAASPLLLSAPSEQAQLAERDDRFRGMLRRQRRERNYLLSILEALPEGVVVQDQDGHAILMNSRARELVLSHARGDREAMRTLDELVQGVLGSPLAPGIYAIGNPQSVDYAGRMLQIQAAAVVSMAKQRLGTIILLRDISEIVQRDYAQEQLLRRLAEDIQEPLAGMARRDEWRDNDLTRNFVRELSRHANALQKMIVDMRDLVHYTRRDASRMQRPLSLETLLWAVANDWRQVAHAANQTMHVVIEKQGLFVLGDEGRLRWAIGNIVDNAIKYTPTGGAISLEVKEDTTQYALVRVRDSGVGIAEEDKPYLFAPFFRGTPRNAEGEVLRVPGMGQGLALSRQIIEAHGGAIRIRSRVGVGTAVYIRLPLTVPVPLAWPQLATDVTSMHSETAQIVVPPDEREHRR